jgi:hypothetical protein
MFLADYFQRFLGRNPFGVSALDIKTYYMARDGVLRWADTTKDAIRQRHPMPELSHNALDDARVQAALFRRLLQGRAR